MTDRRFPILVPYNLNDRPPPDFPTSVPWSFVAPHEQQALRNHDQTLDRLAQRGGLDAGELLAVVEGFSWGDLRVEEYDRYRARLLKLLEAHAAPEVE